jgi:hypothetical protein
VNFWQLRVRGLTHLRGKVADVALAWYLVTVSENCRTGRLRIPIPPLLSELWLSLLDKKLLEGLPPAEPHSEIVALTLLPLNQLGSAFGVVGGQQTPGNIQGIAGPLAALVKRGQFFAELRSLHLTRCTMIHALLDLGSFLLFAVRSEGLAIFSPVRWHIRAKRLRCARLERHYNAAANPHPVPLFQHIARYIHNLSEKLL